jgi:ATP-dependent DNA helicase RecQ
MIAFAESTQCRMAALVHHFGDTTDKALPCGLCDICNPGSDTAAHSAHQPTAQERTWLREILSALEHRSTSTGKLFTDVHLKKESKKSQQDARKDFDTLLDGLARAGLITLTNDTFRNPEGRDITYRKAAITHEGRSPDDETLDTVWLRTTLSSAPSGKKSSTKSRTPKTTTDHTLTPAAEQLFEQLRNWRTETARPTKTPAFMILSDAVLRAIAHAAPQNLTALHAVPGMGPSKVDRYGAALIALCRGNLSPAPKPIPQSLSSQPERQSLSSEPTQKSMSSRPKRSEVERPAVAPATSSAVHQNKRSAAPPPPPELTPAQEALEARLKDWRREEAKAAGLPTFFIFSDTVLRNIALAAPSSLDDLRNIRGASPEKITQFGATLLNICRP